MKLNGFILTCLAAAVILLSSALSAFGEDIQTVSQKSPTSQINYSDESPVGVYKVPQAAKDVLLALNAVVRHGRIDGCYVAELTPTQAQQLSNLGFRPEKIFDSLEEEDAFILNIHVAIAAYTAMFAPNRAEYCF